MCARLKERERERILKRECMWSLLPCRQVFLYLPSLSFSLLQFISRICTSLSWELSQLFFVKLLSSYWLSASFDWIPPAPPPPPPSVAIKSGQLRKSQTEYNERCRSLAVNGALQRWSGAPVEPVNSQCAASTLLKKDSPSLTSFSVCPDWQRSV